MGVTSMDGFIDSKSGKVAYTYNEINDSGSIVIIAHGFKSDKTSRTGTALSKKLNEAGIPTIAFDMYGHGQSEGEMGKLTMSKAVDNALAVYDFVKKMGYKKIGLSGSSFSGMVGLIVASKRELAALSLKCPVFDYKKLWDDRVGPSGIDKWKKEGNVKIFDVEISFETYTDASKYSMCSIAGAIKAPTLVIHGSRDATVPISQAEELISCLTCEKELFVVSGADHFFQVPQHFDKMIEKSAGWFKRFLG